MLPVSLVCPFLKKRHIRVFSKRLAYFTPVLLVQFFLGFFSDAFFYSTHTTKLLLYSDKEVLDNDINLTNPTTTKGISI
jgi:hypothetical protein